MSIPIKDDIAAECWFGAIIEGWGGLKGDGGIAFMEGWAVTDWRYTKAGEWIALIGAVAVLVVVLLSIPYAQAWQNFLEASWQARVLIFALPAIITGRMMVWIESGRRE